MPFQSKKQQRYFFAAENEGKLPQGIARRWAHETDNLKDLPEEKKKKQKKKQTKEALLKLARPGFKFY